MKLTCFECDAASALSREDAEDFKMRSVGPITHVVCPRCRTFAPASWMVIFDYGRYMLYDPVPSHTRTKSAAKKK